MSITVVMWFKKKSFLIEKSCWLPSNAVSDRMAFLIVWSWNISCFFILCLCPCFACFFFISTLTLWWCWPVKVHLLTQLVYHHLQFVPPDIPFKSCAAVHSYPTTCCQVALTARSRSWLGLMLVARASIWNRFVSFCFELYIVIGHKTISNTHENMPL